MSILSFHANTTLAACSAAFPKTGMTTAAVKTGEKPERRVVDSMVETRTSERREIRRVRTPSHRTERRKERTGPSSSAAAADAGGGGRR